MIFETPSSYVPAGASFDGAGAAGASALIDAADADGAAWSAAVDALGEVSWAQVGARVHHRTVGGETVWGLLAD